MTYTLIQRENRGGGNIQTVTFAETCDADQAWQNFLEFMAKRLADNPGMYGPYGTHRLVLVGSQR